MECLEKMLSTSHFKKLLIFFISFILLVEILVSVFPVYYFDNPEKFLFYHTRKQIENGNNDYDIIILGDSTSMSLDPSNHKNVYNFSLPGMGVRYYPQFLDKYQKFLNKNPKAIVMSGSFLLVSNGKGSPLVDQSLSNYAYPDISLFEYLYNRSVRRIRNIINNNTKYNNVPITREANLEWEFFSHRYFTFFSAFEINSYYRGAEWFYLMSQSVPLLYKTYMFRKSIENIFNVNSYKFEKNLYGTEYCTCEKLKEKVCLPPTSQYQDNRIVEEFRKKHQGYYNISDRLSPKLLYAYELEKENTIKRLEQHSEITFNYDFSYTEEFIKNLNQQKILYIYLAMPYPDIYNNGKLIPTFHKEFEKFLSKFPNTKMFYFPTMYYDAKYYSDMVHLNCEGAKKLNDEFQNVVLPQIIQFIESYKFK